MKKNIKSMKKIQMLFSKYEKSRKVLKAIINNDALSHLLRERARIELDQLPKSGSITRHKNFCILTGRGRFIFSGYRLSRLMLQKLSKDGMLIGIRKSS
ncbi:ribosomal protein S14 (mitochondrion) [Nannochloropsis gaditana]|uniref:Ribosomal protein S14 n=2 Tax=Nannochloropsis gaditana TaxID=72520 RepID=K9ZXW9_9STRA|nr:ribosomal protein S14 [Nannochloropsis gaditana]AFZ64361.1 ribosomal protein S14 [Nannochloropsis gaditana]AGI49063.1 ribosomal protein S14 [Nannochloropsis gaditana]